MTSTHADTSASKRPTTLVVLTFVTSLAGVLAAWTELQSHPSRLVLVLVGAMLGPIFVAMIRPTTDSARLHWYLAAFGASSALAVVASRGSAGLCVLPFVGECVFLLPRVRALVLSTLAGFFAAGTFYYNHASEAQGVASIIGYLAAVLFVALFVGLSRDEASARMHAQWLSQELQSAYAQLQASQRDREELLLAQARNAMAREVHDGLGHCLTAARVHARILRRLTGDSSQLAGESLTALESTIDQGLYEVRRSVGQLAQPHVSGDANALLRDLASRSRTQNCVVETNLPAVFPTVCAALIDAIYRISQEAISNALKHADATVIALEVSETDGLLRLRICDNGNGNPGIWEGHGLAGMRERAQELGGSLSVGNLVSGGAFVELELPHD